MVVINTETAVAIASIVASGVLALVVFLINKLLSYERQLRSYEHRITKLEGKLEDWSPYFQIIIKGITDHFWSSARNHTRRGVKNDT